MCKLFNLQKPNKHFTTDVNICTTVKNIKTKLFKKETNDLKNSKVTEKKIIDSSS